MFHVASTSTVLDPRGYYAYCASDCGSLTNWGIATVSDGASTVIDDELALDPAGHPRMLLQSVTSGAIFEWQYAACNSGCTNGANWTVTTLTPIDYIDINSSDPSMHNFALDSLGHPRFVYYDTAGAHTGTYYAYCDALDCTMHANWFEIPLTADHLSQSSLTFTAARRPRLAAVIYADSVPTPTVNYLACDTDCATNPANWTQTPLYERGGGLASWVLRLDSSDRPRMAFYQASVTNGPGNILYYVWCNTGCSTDTNWVGKDVGLGQSEGTDPMLALDSQDHPRIAYQTSVGNLGYGACNSNCESPAASWQHRLVETHSALDADWPIPPPVNCSSSYWIGGYRPSLALDAGGNARVGYDAVHIHGGGCAVGQDYQGVRFVSFGGGVQSFLYLPLIVR